ncbi:hypothetical protein [Gulosibacter massiliensis]|uniref:hypothetical protein n=1 Tax=Gulosibacter massiliensis TaxID=2479839 RepID=UPI000F638204|nr:hypothetical protein [Gulosibacter massiliensis]
MRIRSIKPEFWRSSDVSSLDIEDRLLFIGLWSYVDDNGIGLDKLAAIAADLFADDIAADASETFARVSRGLARLSEAGRIIRYRVESVDYLEIVNWTKHQRIDKPGKPRYPRHDAADASIRESVANARESVAPGTGEQRNRGTEEQGNRGTDSTSEIADAIRPDVKYLLDLLDDEIVANGGKPSGSTKRNQDAMRLLLYRDGKTIEQVEACIRWCQADEFWRSNILSASKLREKYQQLQLQAQRKSTHRLTPTERAAQTMAIGRSPLATDLDLKEIA